MLTVTSSKLIPMDAHRLWDVLTSPAAYPDWAANHVEFVGDVPAQFGAGTDYVQKVTSIGSKNDVKWRIDQAEPGTRVVQSGSAPMGVKITNTYALAPADDGTELTMTAEFSGAMVIAAKGMLERDTRATQAKSLDNLVALASGG